MTKIERIPSTIHTFTGRMVDPLDLKPEDVCVEDIAHHLSMQCRFSGATRFHYSVAQHSYLASFLVPEDEAFDALMHDAPEYVLQDMARPLKHDIRLGQAYRGAERRIEKVISEVFGVRFPMSPTVHDADTTMLVTEARDIMHGTSSWKGSYKDHPPADFTIRKWSPEKAERKFLARFHDLRREG